MPIDWSAAPDGPGLKLKWADGWIEDFPEDEFVEECRDRPGRIYMYRTREPRCLIEYTLRVQGRHAVLDYGGRFAEVNRRPERDLNIGVTKIGFTDTTRSQVASVVWRDEGARSFIGDAAWASWTPPGHHPKGRLGRFRPAKRDRRPRGFLEAVLRPGQLRFRATLLHAYGQCCMTGSRLVDTLEAAHIMPYRGVSFDHVQNGLLLRADLHRLYDRLLIGVDPDSLRVRLSPKLSAYPEYSQLAGRRLRIPRSKQYRPSPEALRDHWRRFKSSARVT